jgi:hypothetical protein
MCGPMVIAIVLHSDLIGPPNAQNWPPRLSSAKFIAIGAISGAARIDHP